MQHVLNGASVLNINEFYDFIRNYEKAKKENNEIQFFGLMESGVTMRGIFSQEEFQSKKWKEEESDLFIGSLYTYLTQYMNDILKKWETFSSEKTCKAFLQEKIGERKFPNLYAASNFYGLKGNYEPHDYVSSKGEVPFKRFSKFCIATKEEFECNIGSLVDLNRVQKSHFYIKYEILQREVKEAEKETLLYEFQKNIEGEFKEYYERAYFSPKKHAYYVKVVYKNVDDQRENEEFSRFTEEEMAEFIRKKISNGFILSVKELSATNAFDAFYQKYRLRHVVRKKENV